jgi:hypothetical protein
VCRRQACVGALKQEHSGTGWIDQRWLLQLAPVADRSDVGQWSTVWRMVSRLRMKDEALRTRSNSHRYPGTLGEASYRDRCHLLLAFQY